MTISDLFKLLISKKSHYAAFEGKRIQSGNSVYLKSQVLSKNDKNPRKCASRVV